MAVAPRWLEPLLTTSFFGICRIHGDAARSECNMFCLDCYGGAFCFYCRSSRHKDHRVIQIRRSSYHDVVRVSEIESALDISGVQTYVINSARVMFLNERPQPKATSKATHVAHMCEICSRTLLDPLRFCSLGCKLVGVKRNGNASFKLDGKGSHVDDEVENMRMVMMVHDRRRRGESGISSTSRSSSTSNSRRGGGGGGGLLRMDHLDDDQLRGGSPPQQQQPHDIYSPTPMPPPPPNSRRRKGIPHRAPFKS